MHTEIQALLDPIRHLHEMIRDAVVAACEEATVEELAAVAKEEAVKKAMAYFGEGGLGLEVSEQNPCCAYFVGGGGHVSVTASTEENKKKRQRWHWRLVSGTTTLSNSYGR